MNCTGETLNRYNAGYYSQASMRIGLVLFGNGAIDEDGTISEGVLVEELIADIGVVQTGAAGIEHGNGFTLAQRASRQHIRTLASPAG